MNHISSRLLFEIVFEVGGRERIVLLVVIVFCIGWTQSELVALGDQVLKLVDVSGFLLLVVIVFCIRWTQFRAGSC